MARSPAPATAPARGAGRWTMRVPALPRTLCAPRKYSRISNPRNEFSFYVARYLII